MFKNLYLIVLSISCLTLAISNLRLRNPFTITAQMEILGDEVHNAIIDPSQYFSTAESLVELNDTGDIIIISGPIIPGMEKKVESLITPKIQGVIIASPGGDLETAVKISRSIYNSQLSTLVPKHAMCYSACTLIFQAGQRRVAYGDAMFMYHSAKEVNMKTKASRPDQAATAVYWAYLLVYQIDDRLLLKLNNMNVDYYIKAQNSKYYNISTDIIPVDSN